MSNQLISYDPKGCFLDRTGITEKDLTSIHARLKSAQEEVAIHDVELLKNPDQIPDDKVPLDARFLELPEKLLAEYAGNRDESELRQILTTATRIQESVDRVVVLGIGGSYMGARALLESCREPYYNELSRAERGSCPRIYFEGNNVDNDATQGLLNLLGNGREATSVDDRWAVVVISKSGGTLETAVAFRQFLTALKSSCGDKVADFVVPVTGDNSKLFKLATNLGCQEFFEVPDGVGGRFSVLSAVGLIPAAIMGLDIVKLLEGAAAMNEHFRNAPLEENVVLNYVGVCHLMETMCGCNLRVLSAWSKALESVGLWYDQLLAESLGKKRQGATPLTVVNTRDLHSRAQQHQEGSRDKLMTNLIVDAWRCDSLAIGHSDLNDDELNDLSDKTLPEIMTAAIDGTNEAYASDGRPTADIHLPAVNAHVIGQLLQMFMIATAVEGRLIGINPYGQDGVEQYKRFMTKNLRGT